jgi:hypothetical protein
MKGCSSTCEAICDFCRMYNFNGDKDGAYTDEGYCVFHEKPMLPEAGCDDFICTSYKVKIRSQPPRKKYQVLYRMTHKNGDLGSVFVLEHGNNLEELKMDAINMGGLLGNNWDVWMIETDTWKVIPCD